MRKLIYALLVILLLAAAALLLFGTSAEKRALDISGKNELVKEFIQRNPGFNATVDKMGGDEIRALAEKYPAAYGGLPAKGVYVVKYEKGGSGYSCFVDMETKQTLRCVRTLAVGMNVGG